MEQKGDITFEMVMPNEGIDKAVEIAKKLCEANFGLKLHIVFKDVYCCNAGKNLPLPPLQYFFQAPHEGAFLMPKIGGMEYA